MDNQEKELSPALLEFIRTEFLAALEIYRASNPLVKQSSKTFFACVEFLRASNLSEEFFHRNAFVAAFGNCAAAGSLDLEDNEQQTAEKIRKRDAEWERRDRQDGSRTANVVFPETEKEGMVRIIGDAVNAARKRKKYNREHPQPAGVDPNDLSGLPDPETLANLGGSLPRKQIEAMSAPQLKGYLLRVRLAEEILKQRERQAEAAQ
jgi:hypothetical protein